MTDDSEHPKLNDTPEQAKLEQVNQQALRSQASESEVTPPIQRAAPGRRPLFRT
jgi:hypothetical protein